MTNRFHVATARRALTLAALLCPIAIVAACGDSTSSMNPAAPTAVVADVPQHDESGGAISSATGKGGNANGNGNSGGGSNNGGGKDNDKGHDNGRNDDAKGSGGGNQPTVPSGNQAPTNTTPTTTRKVEIEGVISAKAGDSITVSAQDIAVPATCEIRHGDRRFTFADLRVGDRVHVKATRTTSGAGATATTRIEASDVKLQNADDDDDRDDSSDGGSTTPTAALVSVAALDATASETGPDLGAFRLTRTGAVTAALTVTVTVTGTATNGTDYQMIPLTVTFAAGQATATVVVTPLADAIAEGSETVVLTVIDGTGYAAGAPATATVTIAG